MKDRLILRNLATLIETMPSMGNLRKTIANRLRVISDTIPLSQEELKVETPEIAAPEMIVTDGLPSGVCLLISPGPLEGSPPTVTGCLIQGKLFGNASNPGWFYVSRGDSKDITELAITLEKEGLSSNKLLKE